MRLPTITDSRGNKSQTLFWVSLALTAIITRYIVGGLWGIPAMGVTEFATAFSLVLAPWVAREGIEKLSGNSDAFKLPPGA